MRNSFKIFLGLMLSLLMCLSMTAVTVMAEDGNVAQIDETTYPSLAEAIAAANEGDTVTLLADITGDVTIKKDLTIDGNGKNYTGNISVNGNTVDVVVKNVNFVGGTGYAITTNSIKSITVENCNVKDYGFGFLYANKSTPTVVVKDVTVENCNYGFHWVYGSIATLENVKMTNVAQGIYIQNYGAKTVTLKNCDITSIEIWERSGYSAVQTVEFEGANTVGTLENSQYAKYVLAAEDATLTASEGANITTTVADDKEVVYIGGSYKVLAFVPVAIVNETPYETLAEAIAAAQAGDTITFVADITEDVTVSKSVTIDGAGNTYTGQMKLTNKASITIKNVNFDGKGYNGYAVETRGAYYLTIEDCTAKNYGYGFVQLASGTVLTTVKNVTVSNMNYGVKVDYSTAVVLENVDITAGVAAVLNSNYGEKTITIKDSKLNILGTWTRNNTKKSTYVFEGVNSIDEFVIDAALDNFKLAAGATLTAPNDITVTTDVEGYEVVYADGKYSVVEEKDDVAKIGEQGYATLAEAIAAAQAGDTITFVADITEDVTVNKSVTIDGAGKTYTGKMNLTNKASITIKNVNFDGKGYDGYAVETRGAYYLTIEDCTAKNYGYGFVQLASGTVLTTVKNVTVSNMNYGVKVDYSNAVVLENVDITASVAAVLNSNYGEKTITIKDSNLSILGTWTRNNTIKSTYVFEGKNSIDEFVIDAALDNFKLAAGATLTAPEEITVTTDVEGYKVVYAEGTYSVAEKKNYVAQIGEQGYESLTAAIAAANAGDTITLLADITEDVTVNKSVTIDGAGKTYTGKMNLTNKASITIKNVNFDGKGYDGYAVETRGAYYLTIEDCTAKNYGYGFVQMPKSAVLTVTNVTVSDVNYGFKVDYSGGVTMEKVNVVAQKYGIYDSNYGSKTYTIKNCSFSNIKIWERDGKTGVATFKFEGANTVGTLDNSQYAKYVLADVNATLTAPAGAKVTTTVDGKDVAYESATYKLVDFVPVAQIRETKYSSIQKAIDAANDGDTITITADHEIDGSKYINATFGYDTLIYVNGKNITLDLNGYTVEVKPNAPDANGGLAATLESIIFVGNGGKLTIQDSGEDGGFQVNEGTDLYCLIYNCDSTLTINGGKFFVEETITAGSLIYADNGHTTTINDGVFVLDNASTDANTTKPWIFNTEGKNKTFVQVSGGKYNQDLLMNFGTAKDCEVKIPDGKALVLGNDRYWTLDNAVARIEDGRSYASVNAALEAAKAEDTVKIIAEEATEGTVMVAPDVTLDLNGKILNATNIAAFNGSNVIDSTDGTGLLKITSALFSKDNEQLPLFDEFNGGYRFFNCSVMNLGYLPDSTHNSIKSGYRIEFAKKEAYDLLATSTDLAELYVDIHLVKSEGNESGEMFTTYVFSDEIVNTFATKAERQLEQERSVKRALTLTFTGVENASGIITVPVLKTGLGISFSGAEETYAINKQ